MSKSLKVKTVYVGGYIANLGIVEEGPYKDWLVYWHPDGKWVTLADLSEYRRPADGEGETR